MNFAELEAEVLTKIKLEQLFCAEVYKPILLD
jgi:hypothetical protein